MVLYNENSMEHIVKGHVQIAQSQIIKDQHVSDEREYELSVTNHKMVPKIDGSIIEATQQFQGDEQSSKAKDGSNIDY